MITVSRLNRDLILSFGSQLMFKFLGFLIVALLARHLAQDDFGRLTLALTICTLAVMVTDIGYSTDLIRRIASDTSCQADRLGLVLGLRIPLLIAYFCLVNVIIAVTKPDLLLVTLGIGLSIAFKDLHRTYSSVLIARRRIARTIVAFGSGLLVILLGICIAVLFDWGLGFIVPVYIIGWGCVLAIIVGQYRHLYGGVSVDFSVARFKKHVLSAFLLFAVTGLSYFHFAMDSIAIGYLLPYEELAKFSAAAQLLEASQFAVRPVTIVMFPLTVQLCFQLEWSRLTRLLVRMYLAALSIGLFAWGFVMLTATDLVAVVFSDRYAESAEILRILFLSVPGLFITTVGLFVATALHREKAACYALCSALTVKMLLYPVVIPEFGLTGTAWLTTITQSLLACWLVYDSFRRISMRSAHAHAPDLSQA